MELLHTRNLEFLIKGEPLFASVTLTLRSGMRVGLVGANGVGKSTFLAVLAGKKQPSSGTLTRALGARLTLLPQHLTYEIGQTVWQVAQRSLAPLDDMEKELRRIEQDLARADDKEHATLMQVYAEALAQFEHFNGYDAQARLQRMLADLGLPPAYDHRLASELSLGQQRRLALACALCEPADILLLDEPSNHLDMFTRKHIIQHLLGFKGALVLASHDRTLLDALCTHTAYLEHQKITLVTQSYSRAEAQKQHLKHRVRKAQTERDKEMRRLAEALKAIRSSSAQAQTIRKRMQHLKAQQEIAPAAPPTATLHLGIGKASKRHQRLLSAHKLTYSYPTPQGPQQLIHEASLEIFKGDKVVVLGPNGVGKSTLLKLLSGALISDNLDSTLTLARDVYPVVFDQTYGLTDDVDLLAQLTPYVPPERAMIMLARVGLADKAHALPKALSEGQKARAGITLLTASDAPFLLLDEPTEHLDIVMLGVLGEALVDTSAAVVFVTHDEALAQQVATRVFGFEAGVLVEYRGGVDGYWRGERRLEPAEAITNVTNNEPPAPPPLQQRDILEKRLVALETILSDPSRHAERDYQRFKREYTTSLDELGAVYEALQPPPAPAFFTCEGAVELWGDITECKAELTVVTFESNTLTMVTLHRHGTAAHLVVRDSSQGCTLLWAQLQVIQGAVRLAIERLDVQVIQIQSALTLTSIGFQEAGQGWWTISRYSYERAQGFIQAKVA